MADPSVVAEAERQVVVAARLEQIESALEMRSRLKRRADEQIGEASNSLSDTGFGRTRRGARIREEGCGVRAHRIELTAEKRADPQTEISRQPLRPGSVARRGERHRERV